MHTLWPWPTLFDLQKTRMRVLGIFHYSPLIAPIRLHPTVQTIVHPHKSKDLWYSSKFDIFCKWINYVCWEIYSVTLHNTRLLHAHWSLHEKPILIVILSHPQLLPKTVRDFDSFKGKLTRFTLKMSDMIKYHPIYHRHLKNKTV